jgi:hypothetical protein
MVENFTGGEMRDDEVGLNFDSKTLSLDCCLIILLSSFDFNDFNRFTEGLISLDTVFYDC